ncbi:hypothetical protein RLIN73S_00842 [Rhodanobacter lindaniclasticus]
MSRDLHARHPGERRGPAPSPCLKSLGPSFRWGDDVSAVMHKDIHS